MPTSSPAIPARSSLRSTTVCYCKPGDAWKVYEAFRRAFAARGFRMQLKPEDPAAEETAPPWVGAGPPLSPPVACIDIGAMPGVALPAAECP